MVSGFLKKFNNFPNFICRSWFPLKLCLHGETLYSRVISQWLLLCFNEWHWAAHWRRVLPYFQLIKIVMSLRQSQRTNPQNRNTSSFEVKHWCFPAVSLRVTREWLLSGYIKEWFPAGYMGMVLCWIHGRDYFQVTWERFPACYMGVIPCWLHGSDYFQVTWEWFTADTWELFIADTWEWFTAGYLGMVHCRLYGNGSLQVKWEWFTAGYMGMVHCRLLGNGSLQITWERFTADTWEWFTADTWEWFIADT